MSERYYSPEIWAQVKTEYLADTMSLRELGKKYSMSPSSICRKAKTENWQVIKDSIKHDVNERLENMIVDTKVSNTERAVNMTNRLLVKLEQSVDVVKPKDISAIKGIVASLKDLGEMGVFKVVDAESTDIRVDMGSVDEYSD